MYKNVEEHKVQLDRQENELKSRKDKLWNNREKITDFTSWNLQENDLKTINEWKEDPIESKRKML